MQLRLTPVIRGTTKLLPASKSISNRALIINALAGGTAELSNLSDANDTQLMLRQVRNPESVIDIEDAGTTMRFLTAYFAVTNQTKTLTGTARMKERPIALLVNALRSIGAEIDYLGEEGFPPIKVKGLAGQRSSSLSIRGDISSQYISALMMVAPALPDGLTIRLEGKVGSRPYIEMTAAIMKHFGATAAFESDTIRVARQTYKPAPYTVESDWSAASYWFAFAALAREAELFLPRLSAQSLQGDNVVASLMTALGVASAPHGDLLRLTKTAAQATLAWDFTDCPDLAQTVCVVCAAKGVRGTFTGLESLRIKETDRISALQQELRKIGGDLRSDDEKTWHLVPSTILPSQASFATYKDHRMAMAFAPLVTLMDVEIDNPDVVRKSYPNFWNDVKSVGVRVG